MTTSVELLGYVAAALGTVSWLPQTIKTWRSRAVADLSFWALLLVFATVSAWLIYGALIVNWPLIVANVICVILVGLLVIAKWRFDPRRARI
ncbi:SemiSWEET family transporter [Pseudooceanicola sp.]|uniref:SemiSWEET family sugar transporter n=1 Tax=Pseudooceanicola sp. TaxID=1914328 RepID=UPI00261D737A|nr:SemiSWEET family transporter [Pseudooceanicola sp.]MDF1856837.1 SemiSWEET family transporter [Pseudooceanicola sp.]